MRNLPDIGMKLPKQFFALWKDSKGKWHQFDTNDQNTAEKKAAINDGEVYIDNRYAAKKRLYWYLVRVALYGKENA
jgi:hypothetical protein